MRPSDCPVGCNCLSKIFYIFKFFKNAKIEKWVAIIDSDFPLNFSQSRRGSIVSGFFCAAYQRRQAGWSKVKFTPVIAARASSTG